MTRRKGFNLSINAVITIVVGLILVAILVSIAGGFFQEGKSQIITLAGL